MSEWVKIAHRIQLIKQADYIVFLDKGVVAGVGIYDDLLNQLAEFRAIASYG